jgi:N6-adenosine-specific RNA methylase IME4
MSTSEDGCSPLIPLEIGIVARIALGPQPLRGGRQNHKAFPSIFDDLAQEHSRKPDEFYQIVLDRTPDQARCDLLSRETRPGFDGWGNEHGKFNAVA